MLEKIITISSDMTLVFLCKEIVEVHNHSMTYTSCSNMRLISNFNEIIVTGDRVINTLGELKVYKGNLEVLDTYIKMEVPQ